MVEIWKGDTQITFASVSDILAETKKNWIEENIRQKLADCGVEAKVFVYGDFVDAIVLKKVLIKLDLSGISQLKMNIVEIRRTVSAFCELGEEHITVYGTESERVD